MFGDTRLEGDEACRGDATCGALETLRGEAARGAKNQLQHRIRLLDVSASWV